MWKLLVFLSLCLVASAEGDAAGLTTEQRNEVETTGEKIEFRAEVNRLMDIIINSLYSHREIFLRELVSNCADASDKARYLALTDKSFSTDDMDIKISIDKTQKTLTITDKGIGMTKADLINNLGTVAKSGTTEFLEAVSKNSDKLSLIGQFGVGFYSVYLVADKVTVVSKHPQDKQHIWESTANAVFTVAEDPRGDTLGRGTSITLHLKEDSEEFLNENEVEKIVQRYSQFVNVPILIQKTKTVNKEVPVEEEKTEPIEEPPKEPKGEDELEVTEEQEPEVKKPKTKTVSEQVTAWEQINQAKPLWTRDPKTITDEEYQSFFKALTKDKFPTGAMEHVHFVAEGEMSFKALLYIPKSADSQAYADLFSVKKSGVSLYVRKVLISDEFEDFLPRYMNFIRGIVESDDLPLNVSRETLAQSRILKVISKKLVRKVLDLLRKMADGSVEPDEEAEAQPEGSTKKEGDPEKYEAFWKEYGKSIKFGIIDDRKNKAKLSKLLRCKTTASEGKEVSLDSYISRLKEGQKYIYYITGESEAKVLKSPFLEKVTDKGYEVLLLTDALDEYLVGSLTEFNGVELQSVTKEGLKLGDEERDALKKSKEEYKPLVDWFAKVYGDKVEKVAVSNRLGKSPCILVTSQYGWTANMQRIVQGSTLSSGVNPLMAGKKTFEVNVHHPIMQALNSRIAEDSEDVNLKDLALMLLDAAQVSSGFSISDYKSFYQRMNKIVSTGLGVDPNAPAEVEVDDPDEPESEPVHPSEIVRGGEFEL